jgi:predicted RNA binding protein YcfA (HicA-like mRNA interferase family)
VRQAFERLGFEFHHEGSRHTIYRDPRDPSRFVSLPRHARTKRDLLRGILRGVGVSEETFMEQY